MTTGTRQRSRATRVVCIALLGLQPAMSLAAEGVYTPLPLKKAYDHEVIKDCGELHDYFVTRGLRIGDLDTERYLNDVGRTVVPESTDDYIDYRFFVLRDPTPNAFALPDGQMYVNTGMIARLEDEAQLAALLAHEVTHVAGHHGIIAMRADHKKGVASAVLSGVLAPVGGGWAAAANIGQSLAFTLSTLGYSRELEEEADVRGFDRLLAAGYDVNAMPELFDFLKQDPEGLMTKQASWWSTHPSLDKRTAYLQQLADNVPADRAGTSRYPDKYRELTRNVALMTVTDYINADFPRSALVLGRKLLERYPDENRLHVMMGDAYQVLGPRAELDPEDEWTEQEKRRNRNQRARKTRSERMTALLETDQGRENQRRNLAAAEQAYLDALSKDDNLAVARRGLGEVYDAQGRLKDAAREYLKYLKMAPEANDRQRIIAELKRMAEVIRSEQQ